jgi:hypothetical protein
MVSLSACQLADPIDGGAGHEADGLFAHLVDFLLVLDDEEMPGLGVVAAGSPDRSLENEVEVFPAKLVRPEPPDASSVSDGFHYRVHWAVRLPLWCEPHGGTDNNSPKIEELL